MTPAVGDAVLISQYGLSNVERRTPATITGETPSEWIVGSLRFSKADGTQLEAGEHMWRPPVDLLTSEGGAIGHLLENASQPA
ncbi:hypothetical protein DWB68_03995 [Galactobacter valiniphilus]|uniref:Uncharacterized protein n=2 Tax=Galactobacter valiniphilus TaxID=2676122 RepID=A0A399JBK8_9MICC|nr:hypothetical protein DWB68_03995 [Galactobacter valiniphilus]